MGLVECDDGNNFSGDGCSSTCKIELGYFCKDGSSTSPDICREICGDGMNFLNYQCDDGNTLNGDGCSFNCTIEANFTCVSSHRFGGRDLCHEDCGNGQRLNLLNYSTVSENMTCDDGNVFGNDGCSALCEVEKGWTCTYNASRGAD